jgi:O-antigen/teichoic acid export membrane protein
VSATRKIIFAVGVVWFVRAVSILSNLFLLPVLARVMDREEVGTWMLLNSNSQVFLALLSFGVAPTLTRHIALAKGRSGAHPDVVLTSETQTHIADLVTTGRRVLHRLAIFTFFAALIIGTAFFSRIDFQRVSLTRTLLAWLVLCAGYAIGVWVSYLDCWMMGIGFVGWSGLIASGVALLTLCANIAAAVLGGGMLTLACIFVVAGLIQRAVLRYSLYRTVPNLFRIVGTWRREYARGLVRPSLYAWLYTLGGFLVLQTGAYFIVWFRGPQDVLPYNAAFSLVLNLQMLAVTFAITSNVFLSQAWQGGDYEGVRRHTIRFTQIGMIIMATGVGFVMTAGREFIQLWLGKPELFVGYGVLAMFCFMLTMEAQSVILITCSRATEDERYAVVGLTAGITTVILTWWLIGPLGLFGVALSTVIAQLLTSNWYCVYRPFVRLQINGYEYLRRVVLLWAIAFGVTTGTNYLIVEWLRQAGYGRKWMVFAAAAISALVLGAAFWWGVFEATHRRRLLARLAKWMPFGGGQLR